MKEDADISALFNDVDEEAAEAGRAQARVGSESRVKQTLNRVNTSLSQKHTLGFALVNLWVTIAKVLAPVFALLAKKHARSLNTNEYTNTHSGEKNGNV